METLIDHWNKIFKATDENKLGWYEDDFSETLKFLDLIPGWKSSKIFVPGVGTSGLVDILLRSDATLVLNDLSPEAIEKSKNKCIDRVNSIKWLCQDISKLLPLEINDIDIWIDRAVLHFLTDDNCIGQYFKNVNTTVKIGGYAIFAEFSKKGATRCAGLDLRRYDVKDLEKNLPAFKLIVSEEYTYMNPKGDPRPYIYTLFKKIKFS